MGSGDLKNLYNELFEKVNIENNYIQNEKEIDDKKLNNIVMKKIVTRDKIDKFMAKNIEINEVEKADIIEIINNILKKEEENRNIYSKRLYKIKSDIIGISKEKKLQDVYFKSGVGQSHFDSKK